MSNELNDKSSNYNKSEDGDSSAQTKKGDNTTDWHTGYIQGHTFSNKEVKFRLHNGRALFEGDIILADTPIGIEHLGHRKVKGVGIRGDMYRWPRGEIPYIISVDIPNQNRITDAIRHWEIILQSDSLTVQILMLTTIKIMYHLIDTYQVLTKVMKRHFIVQPWWVCKEMDMNL